VEESHISVTLSSNVESVNFK